MASASPNGFEIYFDDVGDGSSSAGGSPAKKGRGGGGAGAGAAQVSRCQVEGCNVDLSDAKSYYSRHKVCAKHSKSPKVLVSGLHQRFCQQCSRSFFIFFMPFFFFFFFKCLIYLSYTC